MRQKPDSQQLRQWDRQYVWHPFTQMSDYVRDDAPIITEGDGRKLIDSDGRSYYDGVSSLWLNAFGHRVPEIDAAIREQLGRIAHSTLLGQGSEASIVLARRLVEVAPSGLQKVFYSDSGATAVEIAMKMAVQFWANQTEDRSSPRQRFIAFENGYHGDTFGPMSLVWDDLFHQPFVGMLEPHFQIPFPRQHVAGSLDRCRGALRTLLAKHAHEVAAVITEPVQGAGGMIVPPAGFLRMLREVCDEFGVLLIVDEVATGFGRTGRLFACEYDSIAPDLLCLGKGITGGYLPLAATLATERIYDAFLAPYAERKQLFHGHSYTGNALACAAALAALELFPKVLAQLKAKIERITVGLESLRAFACVGEIRQSGTMCAVEIVPVAGGHYQWRQQAGKIVCDATRAHGMILRSLGSNVIYMPPLASELEEIDEMFAIFRLGLTDAARGLARTAGDRSSLEAEA
jgi:adenosylmethionine-8-amino-7-oxononanoate aminotransferase